MEQEMINEYHCKMAGHNDSQIQSSCENINCKQFTRKICSYCIPLHRKDPDFKESNIKNLRDLQHIIISFKNNKQEMINNIYLQTDIQRLIITIEMIDLIEKFQLRESILLNIQYKLEQLEEQIKVNLNINNYLGQEDRTIGINQYLQNFEDKLLKIDNQKDEYIKNLENSNFKYEQENESQIKDEGSLKKLFKSFKPGVIDLKSFLEDTKISGNKLFEKKYQKEKKWSIPIFEVLMKQSYNLKSNVPLNQFKFLKERYSDLDDYQDYYLQSFSQVYSIEFENYLDQSLFLVNKSIQINNKYPKSIYLKGVIQYDKKYYYESIKYFEQCVRLDPQCLDAYIGLGNSQRQTRNYQDAITSYDKALKIDQYSVKSLIGKATVLKDQRKFEEAIELYEKVIELEQKNMDAYCGIGLCYHYMGKYKEAINVYEKAIKLDPHNLKAYINKGLAHHISQNNQEDAIKMFERAIELDPNCIAAYNHLGKALYKDNKNEKALKVYNQIIIMDSQNLDGYLGKGELLIVMGKPTDAQQIFQRILSIDSKNDIAQKRLQYLNRKIANQN